MLRKAEASWKEVDGKFDGGILRIAAANTESRSRERTQ